MLKSFWPSALQPQPISIKVVQYNEREREIDCIKVQPKTTLKEFRELIEKNGKAKCPFSFYQKISQTARQPIPLSQETTLEAKGPIIYIEYTFLHSNNFQEEEQESFIKENLTSPPQASQAEESKSETSSMTVDSSLNQKLQNYQEALKQIPECALQTIVFLLVKTYQLLLNLTNEKVDFEGLLIKFQSQIKTEELETKEIENLIFQTQQQTASLQYQASRYESIYKQLQPLDILYTQKLISKSLNAASQIKGQEAVFLLGGTGAGKSTTLQWLAGAEMVEKQVSGMTNIQAKDISKHPELVNVTTAPLAKSVTEYLTEVMISYQAVGITKRGSVPFVDCPGFIESRGAELEMANSIGIIAAIKSCKSIRLVLVLGQKGMGNRLEGLLLIINILVGMFPNIESNFGCIQYLFTKYSLQEKAELQEFIRSKLLSLTDAELRNQVFVRLLEDIIAKIEANGEPLVVYPLTDKPKTIFQKICDLKPMLNPGEKVTFAIQDSTLTIIKDQVKSYQKSIVQALQRGDYRLIQFNLNQIKTLYNLLDYEYIIQIYNECIKILVKQINQQFEEDSKALSRCFNFHNQLTDEDMTEFKKSYEQASQLNHLSEHLKENALNVSAYDELLKRHVEHQSKELQQQEELTNPYVLVSLNKLRIVSKHFATYQQFYKDAQKIIIERFDSQFKEIITKIKLNSFEESAKLMSDYKHASICLSEHIDIEDSKNNLHQVKLSLREHLTSISIGISSILNQSSLNQNDGQQLETSISVMKEAQKTFCTQNSNDYIEINDLYEEQKSKIIGSFDNLKSQIQQCDKKEATGLTIVKPLIAQLEMLSLNIVIKEHKIQDYYEIISQVAGLVKYQKLNVDTILKQIIQKVEGVNFYQLTNSLKILQEAEWIEHYSPGVYKDEIKDLETEVVMHCNQLRDNVKRVNLTLPNYKEIPRSCKKVLEIIQMESLKSLFPQLEEPIESTKNWFRTQVRIIFQQIESKFNIEVIKGNPLRTFEYKIAEFAYQSLTEFMHQDLGTINDELAQETAMMFNKFEEFLTLYLAYIKQDMEESHIGIMQATNSEESTKCSRILLNRLLELKNVEKYELLAMSYEDGPNIMNNWQQIFKKDYLNFSTEFSNLIATKDFDSSIKLLVKVNAMSELDQFSIDQKMFSTLYTETYKQIFSNDAPANFEECREAIAKHDFQKASQILPHNEGINNPAFTKFKTVLDQNLNSTFEKLVQSFEFKHNNFIKNIDKDGTLFEEDLKMLKDTIEKIESAMQCVSSYFDAKNKQLMETFKPNVIARMNKQLEKLFANLHSYIDTSNYRESGQLIGKIESIGQYLWPYIGEKEFEKIQNLQQEQEKASAELIKRFEQNDFFNKMNLQIKDILKKLTNETVNQYFSNVYNRLIHIIEDKFSKEIEKLNAMDVNEEVQIQKQHKLKQLELALKNYPSKLSESFKSHIISEQKYCEDIQSDEILKALSNKDYQILLRFYKTYKSCSIHSPKLSDIKDQFQRKGQEYAANIENKINKNDLQCIIEEMKLFYEFYDQYGSYFQDQLQQQYENSKKLFENKVLKGIDKFSQHFNSSSSPYNSFVSNNQNHIIMVDHVPIRGMNSFPSKENQENDEKLFFEILHFHNDNFKLLNYLIPEAQDRLKKASEKSIQFFSSQQSKFTSNLNPLNVEVVGNILKTMKDKHSTLQTLQESQDILKNLQSQQLIEQLYQVFQVQEMMKRFMQEFCILKNRFLNYDLYAHINGFSERERKNHYLEYTQDLNRIDQALNLDPKEFSQFSEMKKTAQECKMKQSQQSQDIVEKAIKILKLDFIDPERCYQLSLYSEFLSEISIILRSDDHSKRSRVVEDETRKRFNQILKKSQLDLQLDNVKFNLIQMKIISFNFKKIKAVFDNKINETIKLYKKQKNKGTHLIAQLAIKLEKDPYGKMIISEHKFFDNYNMIIFRRKTETQDIDYVLDKIDGTNINKTQLKNRFEQFTDMYTELVKENLTQKGQIQDLVSNVKFLSGRVSNNSMNKSWKEDFSELIPQFMAYIFTIWTLLNAENYFEAKTEELQQIQSTDNDQQPSSNDYLFQPHPAQVISLFRLLGVGKTLNNNLVQIQTGEGKSITLAVAATILALIGHDVRVACYSDYLSQRDYNIFLKLFNSLNLTQNIKYGTFNTLCEEQINSKGDIRKLVQKEILSDINMANAIKQSRRPMILLIDEVDIFFQQQFYGNTYTPSADLSSPQISEFLDYIWDSRENDLSYEVAIASPQFINMNSSHPGWEGLFKEIVKDLLFDVKNFSELKCIVKNDKIGYAEQDNIVFNITFGYKTLFQYYQAHYNADQMKNVVNDESDSVQGISAESLKANQKIQIKCGNYSYAEIPEQFSLILGVSGTLKDLSETEKKVIDHYKIQKMTYIPSVYGTQKLNFNKQLDIKIITSDEYFAMINREIERRLIGLKGTQRSVIVFFESEEKLKAFQNSNAFSQQRDKAKVLTEQATHSEKDQIVRWSTISGKITLVTKTYGRGTDFKCNDDVVTANGGIHIISTFLSEGISEEIQLKGRTARQGEEGSFSMVLLDQDLEKFQITAQDIEEAEADLYALLNNKRNIFFQNQYISNIGNVERAKKEHYEAQEFLEALINGNQNSIKSFLVNFNKGICIPKTKPNRTILLLDATASMHRLLTYTKDTIVEMLSRTQEILVCNNIEQGLVHIQIAVYRNYNSLDEILVASPWETKSENLKQFMSKIEAKKGWVNEAIEIGFEHSNNENAKEPVSQIILIGDAPANSYDEVVEKRQKSRSESLWKKSKFPQATSDLKEIQKLIDSKIPVHAFYVDNKAQKCFEKYSSLTGGKSQFMDVNSEDGTKILTDLVSEQILRDVGNMSGKGDDFVAQYQQRYPRSYS